MVGHQEPGEGADGEKNKAYLMVLIGDGFTPDQLILQGKSHQFVYLRFAAGRCYLRWAAV